jgi:hypothetical protein
MIAENQTKFILEECERAVGNPLTNLRERLLHQRDTNATIWELLVLYGALPLGKVEHEPSSSMPDIRIDTSDGITFWIEVAYVNPRKENHHKDLQLFPAWVRKKLKKCGCDWVEQANIRLDPIINKDQILVPPQNPVPFGSARSVSTGGRMRRNYVSLNSI